MPDNSILRAVSRALERWPAAGRDDALAVLNGAVGDRLHAAGARTALPLELMTRVGASRRFEALDLAAATRSSARRTLLMVHGLMGSPNAWAIGTDDPAEAIPGQPAELGEALARTLDATLLYLRYNSGRHISDNGTELADCLEALHRSRPSPRTDVVAHSMGGLVVRSALHHGLLAGHAWPQAIHSVVMLGTPSHGAPLEQLAHVAGWTLETIWNPWTRVVGKVLNMRASGIKDLRHGFCLEEDWHHKDQDVLRLQAPRPTRAPPHVRWFVAAGSTGASEHWLSRLVGDGLVRAGSARGRGFGTPPPGVLPPKAEFRVFSRTSHMGLMTDPQVREQVRTWLGEPH